jgi:hypothetical protein
MQNAYFCLIERAEGVCLWVVLILKQIEKGLENHDSITLLEDLVKWAPEELDNFFRSIIKEINGHYQEGAHLLLAVLTAPDLVFCL